jgi:hypothetical protein
MLSSQKIRHRAADFEDNHPLGGKRSSNTAEALGGPRLIPNLRMPTKGRQRDRFCPSL